ncbi:hypothetical protein ACOSQ3_028592 [Xanthoceras sorbifolium]
MKFLNVSVKFLGSQLDFLIDQSKEYALSVLFADVYLFTYSKLPYPCKKFKTEVKIPWSSEHKLVGDDTDLQHIYSSFIKRDIRCVRVDIELLPLDTLPSLDFFNEQYPYPEETCTPEATYVYISIDEDDDYPEEESIKIVDSEDYNEDKSRDDSNEEPLSNVASFYWDNDFMLHDSDNNDTAGQTSEAAKRGKRKPYKNDGNENVKLEVWQMFNNIYHFKQHIHTSHVTDNKTFMIKTLNDRHFCHKVHKN